MRIISGSHKGLLFSPDKKFKARPTTDLAKESLFNILHNYFNFDEISVLDLFSGTGSISYEFASRSCKEIISIESDYHHFSFIKKCAIDFKFQSIKCVKTDAVGFLKNCNKKFDIIFADPPFEWNNYNIIPEIVFDKDLLTENGWLIIEHPDNISFKEIPYMFDQRRYSRVNFSFFKNTVSENLL
jgi:16S rRNA (guanine(966)-N(2))-methyltransferase RsmD